MAAEKRQTVRRTTGEPSMGTATSAEMSGVPAMGATSMGATSVGAPDMGLPAMGSPAVGVPGAGQSDVEMPPEAPRRQRRKAAKAVIGVDEIRKAVEILKTYQYGKANLEQRIIENEEWWKLRHWDTIRAKKGEQGKERIEPASAWLLNCILNKHADAMDNYPEPAVLPREPGDEQDAKQLSDILPMVLEENEYESIYDRVWWQKLKSGTGVTGVYWDKSKDNGVGDIDIAMVDLLRIYWQPEIKDIQDSANVFVLDAKSTEELKEQYGDLLKDFGGGAEVDIKEYRHDDQRDTSDRAVVVDWYYKQHKPDGRTVLQFCKFVGDVVLFATENTPEFRDRGWYDDGDYPFVFDAMFPVEDSIAGFGYIDIMRDPQMYIDQMDAIILKNAMMCGKKRYFISDSANINEKEFADWEKDFVHCEGTISDELIKAVEVKGLDTSVYTARQNKIEELKETSGNRDFQQGGTSGGVTAASAVAALQEAGSKLSRDMIKSAYRAHTKICQMVLERIRQFYDQPRRFRITGENGERQFTEYSNQGIKPFQTTEFGVPSTHKAIFDIKVKSQKSNPFSKASQNQLALQLYQAGFFNPQIADQATMVLDMMDFEGKDALRQKLAQNGGVYQQMQQQIMQLTQIVNQLTGGALGNANQAAVQPAANRGEVQSGAGSADPMTRAVASANANTATKAQEQAQSMAEPK